MRVLRCPFWWLLCSKRLWSFIFRENRGVWEHICNRISFNHCFSFSWAIAFIPIDTSFWDQRLTCRNWITKPIWERWGASCIWLYGDCVRGLQWSADSSSWRVRWSWCWGWILSRIARCLIWGSYWRIWRCRSFWSLLIRSSVSRGCLISRRWLVICGTCRWCGITIYWATCWARSIGHWSRWISTISRGCRWCTRCGVCCILCASLSGTIRRWCSISSRSLTRSRACPCGIQSRRWAWTCRWTRPCWWVWTTRLAWVLSRTRVLTWCCRTRRWISWSRATICVIGGWRSVGARCCISILNRGTNCITFYSLKSFSSWSVGIYRSSRRHHSISKFLICWVTTISISRRIDWLFEFWILQLNCHSINDWHLILNNFSWLIAFLFCRSIYHWLKVLLRLICNLKWRLNLRIV